MIPPTRTALIVQVNDVVNSFSGDVYEIVDQAVSVSRGMSCNIGG